MDAELTRLRQQVDELRAQAEATDTFASGLFVAMTQVLPLLLRGHPEARQVHALLQKADERYEELSRHPDRAEGPDEVPGLYEASKMLNRQLGLLGVWPDVDPAQAARDSQRRQVVGRRTR